MKIFTIFHASYTAQLSPLLSRFCMFVSGGPVEEVIIRSPLGKESNHSLKGASGIVRIPVGTR